MKAWRILLHRRKSRLRPQLKTDIGCLLVRHLYIVYNRMKRKTTLWHESNMKQRTKGESNWRDVYKKHEHAIFINQTCWYATEENEKIIDSVSFASVNFFSEV
jgi:hypothetical protein